MRFRGFYAFCLLMLLLLGSALTAVLAEPAVVSAESFRLQSSVVGAAGTEARSSGFESRGTFAQPTAIGIGSSDEWTVYSGFWTTPWVMTGILDIPLEDSHVTMLHRNYPNPFTWSTTVVYSLSNQSQVDLSVFTVEGRRVCTIESGLQSPGLHHVVWDGRNSVGEMVGPGVYFYRLTAGSHVSVKKMISLR